MDEKLSKLLRENGWVLLEDFPRLDDETECDYWMRLYESMPKDQKDSLSGSLAQIFSKPLKEDFIIMSLDIWEGLLSWSKEG